MVEQPGEAQTAQGPAKVYVLSHTHWDREWYQDFQGFRIRLVYMLDELIETMERDPQYKFFMMDGQTIVIDDYLEIRPERREQLMKLIRDGRIDVGPWYVMPDEFLVSGESLIRNLMTGMRRARAWGAEPLRAGYLPDLFGHLSQMPQLLQGFGIDNAVLYRGLDGRSNPSECWWEGADGSRVLVLRLEEERSYGDFYFAVRWPFEDRNYVYEEKELRERADRLLQLKRERAQTDQLIVWDGVDHVEIEPQLPSLLEQLNGAELNAEFVHARFDDYMNALRPLASESWPTVRGEQRAPGYAGLNHMVLANVLSSRIQLKQMNDQCETLLTSWSETWGVFTAWEGRPYPHRFLQTAWEHLLHNHPHDSICGCSIDQVHRDMVYRFDQSRLIAEAMTGEQLRYLVHALDVPWGDEHRTLVVFNGGQLPLHGIVTAELELPAGSDASQTIRMLGGTSFRLYDASGREVSYQVLDVQTNTVKRLRPYRSVPDGEAVDRFRIAFHAEVESFGYTAYEVRTFVISGPAFGEYAASQFIAPVRTAGSMRTGALAWNNGVVELRVAAGGTVSLTQLQTGRTFNQLLVYESEGDIGDGWKHIAPIRNSTVYSTGCSAHVAVEADGPHVAIIRITASMQVPAAASADLSSRSEETVQLEVETRLELRNADPLLRIRSTVRNTARNHRLRVLLPTELATDSYRTNTAYDLVERDIKVEADYTGYLENWANVAPHSGLIALHDELDGLAVYSKGLYETVVRGPERCVALTLLRATRDEVLTSGSDGGQLLSELAFEYGIRLYEPQAASASQLWLEHQQFKNGERALTRKPGVIRYETPHRREMTLPLSAGYLRLLGNALVITAVKGAEDDDQSYIVRLFNPGDAQAVDVLTIRTTIRAARLVSLDEAPVAPAALQPDGGIVLSVMPKEIVTVQLWIGGNTDPAAEGGTHDIEYRN
jgi:alpha-mannosidase/mannosylglycerate hydrolase